MVVEIPQHSCVFLFAGPHLKYSSESDPRGMPKQDQNVVQEHICVIWFAALGFYPEAKRRSKIGYECAHG